MTDEPLPLRECYQVIIGQMMKLAADHKKVPCGLDRAVPYSEQNHLDVHRLSAQLTIINRDQIYAVGELEGKTESLKSEYEHILHEINRLTSKYDELSSLCEQAELYFSLSDRAELSDMDLFRLTVCRLSVRNHNIYDKSDLDRFEDDLQEIQKQLAALKEDFRHCQQMEEVYSDIVSTYYEISNGDYISRLTKEEKKTREQSRNIKRN